MKVVMRLFTGLVVLAWLAGCASQEQAPQEAEPTVEESDEATGAQITEPAGEAGLLGGPQIAYFEAADGTRFETESIVMLPTGGPPAGRLLPSSSDPGVTLYVTRDGSVPSAENNWGGAIDPQKPAPISRPLEGVASYRVVAQLDGSYSEPFTLTVRWRHEESPDLTRPVFRVDGREVSGSVTFPVSDGSDPAARLQIECRYEAATLYINRDGTVPTVDDSWESQLCDGTYLWSPEPTAADYRVIAMWQGIASPVASLSVEWVRE